MVLNKAKYVEAAQKHLGQGKIAHAIAEYEQILRADPKDQNALMTAGDLYVRLGDTSRAIPYFERLARLFLEDGFTSKAIAIYKKIVKLQPTETEPLERLADLYVQQGVLSEARPIFLQLAELHWKAKRTHQAVTVLRQLLEVEPENARVQARLAELLHTLGHHEEAALTQLNSAFRMLDRGEFLEAKKIADAALQANPNNHRATLVKARVLDGTGKPEEAIGLLEGLPEEEDAERSEFLIELYLKTTQAARAVELARKTFARQPNQHGLVYSVAMSLLEGGEADAGLDLLGEIRAAMLQAGEAQQLARALSTAIQRLPKRVEPNEWLVELYRQTNDTTHLPEALEQLAAAYVNAGNFQRSAELFEELIRRDPQNEEYHRSRNHVRAKLGLAPTEEPPAVAEAQPLARAPAEGESESILAPSQAPVSEAPLDEETQQYLNHVLTDVDLFSTYGLPEKAIALLEAAHQRLPRHVGVLEKLLDHYLGSGDDRRTAQTASLLEQIFRQRGDNANTERFAELRQRFQRAAGLGDEQLPVAPSPPAEFSVPVVEAESEPEPLAENPPEIVVEPEPAASAGSAVYEVDLSQEWAALEEQTVEASPKPAARPPRPAAEPAPPPAPAAQEPAPAPVTQAPEFTLELTPPVLSPQPTAETEASTDQLLKELEAELEGLELKDAEAQVQAEVQAEPTAQVQVPPKVEPPAPVQIVPPIPHIEPPPSPPAEGMPLPPKGAPPAESLEQLREVFEEFRSELGEMGEEDEDLETHYNLGIAYREMGLLEEAIAEFQRVAKAVQNGKLFRYSMQCATLLGLSFMDKGEPKIAAMWYQKALETPGLDQESTLALRYDLGVAQELAGELKSALESFNQVYALNIDYRDVAERIAALAKQP